MRQPTSPSEYKAYLQRKNEEQARLLGKIGKLQRENAALRKDKERLDYAEKHLRLSREALDVAMEVAKP